MHIRIILATALALLAPAKAFAWGPDGHRIVCALAWDAMKPATQQRVVQILGVKDRDAFAETCLWADDYRDKEGHKETAGWHYVNVPAGAEAVDVKRDCAGKDSCVLVQIERWRKTLADPRTKPAQRAMALKFVSHFVGDIHQPLHTGRAADDRGGKIKGTFLGKPFDFHWVWDDGILHSIPADWHDVAAKLEADTSAHLFAKYSTTLPLEWANESFAYTRSPRTQYVDQPFVLGEDYAQLTLPVVFNRLTRAGIRLGVMLDAALTPSP